MPVEKLLLASLLQSPSPLELSDAPGVSVSLGSISPAPLSLGESPKIPAKKSKAYGDRLDVNQVRCVNGQRVGWRVLCCVLDGG